MPDNTAEDIESIRQRGQAALDDVIRLASMSDAELLSVYSLRFIHNNSVYVRAVIDECADRWSFIQQRLSTLKKGTQ